MAEALGLLRQYVTTKQLKDVRLEDNDVVIGNARFPRKLKTPYQSKKGAGEPYELDAVSD